MRIAAIILGVAGFLAGLFGAIITYSVGLGSPLFHIPGLGRLLLASYIPLFLSVVGLVGGGLAETRYLTASGVLMLIAGVAGSLVNPLAYIVAGPAFIAGGILALLVERRVRAAAQATGRKREEERPRKAG